MEYYAFSFLSITVYVLVTISSSDPELPIVVLDRYNVNQCMDIIFHMQINEYNKIIFMYNSMQLTM